MMFSITRRLVGVSILVAVAGCGNSSPDSNFPNGVKDASSSDFDASLQDSGVYLNFDAAKSDVGAGDATAGFDVEPSAIQTLTVTVGQTIPTLTYTATLDGHATNAGWSVDRGDLGSVGAGPASTTTFTPTGSAGGLVTLTAGLNGQTISRQINVKIVATQNGANTSTESAQIAQMGQSLTSGGGIGGVGGEGLGGAATSTTLNALANPTNTPPIRDAGAGHDAGDAGSTGGSSFGGTGLTLLYPYDGTVWPRGMLAPLIMWDWSFADADAIAITLTTTSGSFSWTGSFAKPSILGSASFVRHPIPQDVWDMATNTAGGPIAGGGVDKLTMSVVVAKNNVGYGPLTETWTIAPAHLSGIIYYNSYGTALAHNADDAIGGNHMFGGAVLSIHVGDTAPKLVAGTDGDASDCRVCHSVAAGGSRLVVQQGSPSSYPYSSAYDLTTTGSTQRPTMTHDAEFAGMFPDGTMALDEAGELLPLPTDTTPIATSGLSSVATDLGTPAFSPDGTLVVFNPMAGATVNAQSLVVMSFNEATKTFSKPVTVVDDSSAASSDVRPGWGAFLPDGKSVVFHHQSVKGTDGAAGDLYTRKGCKATIGWTNVNDAQHVTTLNALNGKDANGNVYLPKLKTPISMSCTADMNEVGNIDPDHSDDFDLNYEPTANPVASGGYSWVVFTSRRMYGNEADIPPFCSDPRGVDLVENITPKKLWVAAIDLNAQPGTDASHPAFYLPAQELLAGNSRGFWVLDPCRQDGTSCETGDQCCNGYCEAGGDGGALVCANTSPNAHCSMVEEKCTTAADCCDTTNTCVGGFCALSGPR